jgi:6-phosphogluconolactonase
MAWLDSMQKVLDTRRKLVILGDKEEAIAYATEQWLDIALKAIAHHGYFAVALSGGSTPKAIFEKICSSDYKDQLDWSKVLLFWSDERSCPPEDPESNYYMAMQAGFNKVPLLRSQIFRMHAEDLIEQHALDYERLIRHHLKDGMFDLIMVGMGDDGHTASLFPHTDALHVPKDRLVVANHVHQKSTWRMTFTYTQLHNTRHLCVYVLGKDKAPMVQRVLLGAQDETAYPSQRLGTKECPACWIMDEAAASLISP